MLDEHCDDDYNVGMGREVDYKFRVHADSIFEIKRGLDDEAKRLKDDRLKQGYMVWPANLLNYLLCYYLGLSDAEKRRIAEEGMREFQRHLASDEPIPFNPPDGSDSGGTPGAAPGRTVVGTEGAGSSDLTKPARQDKPHGKHKASAAMCGP